jgi:ketosteroid isomerase-like protein
MKALQWLLLFSFALAGCQSVPHSSDSMHDIIQARNDEAARWYASGNVDALASMFTADAWQMPPNATALVGREAIRGFWRQAVQWGTWNFSLKSDDVKASGPFAVERGKYTLRFIARAGSPFPSFDDRGNYVVLWRLDDGVWRAVWDAPVSEVPHAGPEAKEALLRTDREWAAVASEGKDIERILSYWSEDATVYPAGAPVVRGKSALRQYVRESLAIPGFNISWRSDFVSVSADGTLGYATGDNLVVMTGADGKLIRIPGRGVSLWSRDAEGRWKCILDIWNSGPAGR